MNNSQNHIQPIKDLLTKAENIFVLFPSAANSDIIGSALALFHSLKETKKNIHIATPTLPKTEDYPIPGIDKISDGIGNSNLVISLKVDGRDSIDKVSYNLDEEGKVFNLIIQPKKGHSPLNSQDVNYSYAGAKADLVFIIGANRLEDLSIFYEEEKKLFSDAATVAVNQFVPTRFAQYHVSDNQASSLSEIIGDYINQLGLSINEESATSLLYGLDITTKNLQTPSVSANTFDLVAKLLRAGGQRITPTTPKTAIEPIAVQPIIKDQDKPGIPQDWLTPKIYKGSTPRK